MRPLRVTTAFSLLSSPLEATFRRFLVFATIVDGWKMAVKGNGQLCHVSVVDSARDIVGTDSPVADPMSRPPGEMASRLTTIYKYQYQEISGSTPAVVISMNKVRLFLSLSLSVM